MPNPDKPVHAENIPTPTGNERRQVPRDEIVRRAEEIWRERGRPSGTDDAIWLEAESQLQAKAESRPVSGTESRPYIDEPARPLRTKSKSRDPAETGGQTRSATEDKSKGTAGTLRNQ